MDGTLQKTLTFLLFIGIGILLKIKFKDKREIDGLKKIILNLALPATIFIALLGIEVRSQFLWLPVLALGLNFLLFFMMPFVLPLLGIEKHSPKYRTAQLLLPSLAPGLSCFPFIAEFLGDDYLAKAAMADLGNKIFVLLILYMVAMRWFYALRQEKKQATGAKIKSLMMAMVSEPVNLFIAAALLLVFVGINLDTLPVVVSESMQRLSLMMTPLVLLFIGLAVNIKRKQFFQILAILSLRAGLVFFICGIFSITAGITIQNDLLLMLAFGLSACSFWPFAHIAAVDGLEGAVDKSARTFSTNYAVGILALSFPFSVVLILAVLANGSIFANLTNLFLLGGGLLGFGLVYMIVLALGRSRIKRMQKTAMTLSATEGN